jgi:hypothetical protein
MGNESGLYDYQDQAGMNHEIILASWYDLSTDLRKYLCWKLGEDYRFYDEVIFASQERIHEAV